MTKVRAALEALVDGEIDLAEKLLTEAIDERIAQAAPPPAPIAKTSEAALKEVVGLNAPDSAI